MGWVWYVNDLRAFLPAWQDVELASPFPEEPVLQIDADVSLEPVPLQPTWSWIFILMRDLDTGET